MTLKQAFTIWANMSENIALAAKSRSVVQHVLMKKYSDIDLEQITERFVRYSFTRCKEIQEVKTKAASILLHVLRWGAAHGHCQMPTFDISIAHCEDKPVPKVSPERMRFLTTGINTPAYDAGYITEERKPKTEEDMEQTKQTRVSRPVAQIDPTTLKVIKVWPGITTAHNALKIQNIDRAIQRRGIAGGYFWCDEKDIDTFEPAKHGDRSKNDKQKKHCAAPNKKDVTTSIVTPPDENVVSPTLEGVVKEDVTLITCPAELMNFTDEQLINALIIKGWKGQLSKVTVMNL